ncbi:MAG: LON peptidase substrate-binding domain-containing protein [Stellaceae bacterium]
MTSGPFDPAFEELPEKIAIFPLSGVLLLPRGRLPLNVFEPRYLAMVRGALASPLRLIGMVQPMKDGGAGVIPGEPPVHTIGCAGRIVSFAETGDGRYVIELRGVSRFRVKNEPPRPEPYRLVLADWSAFRADLAETPQFIDRDRLLKVLKPYLDQRGIHADWHTLESLMDDRLVTSVAMLAPLEPQEKQALLEAADTATRAELLSGLLEMAVRANAGPPTQLN